MKDNYCSLLRATLPALFVAAAFSLNTTAIAQAPPGSLWYNGDWDFVGSHANESNTSSSTSQVFDDFFVGSSGWMVSGLFSRNLISTTVTGAVWEIRTGVSGGSEGILAASGSTATPTVTPTGRSGMGLNEFTVEVTGLNLFLSPLPAGQFYWLNFTPIGNGTGRSLITTTSGAMAVGNPPGNDGMSWFRPGVGFSPDDFSMGVIGTVVPEPATVALLTCGGGALLIAVRRRHAH
jgi:hypothetical protein